MQRALEAKPSFAIASWQQGAGLGRCSCLELDQRLRTRRLSVTAQSKVTKDPVAARPPRIRLKMLAGVRSRCVGSGLPENSTILLSTPARAASRDRYHYASQLTSYTDKEPRTPYPINLELLVLAHVRLLQAINSALDEVVVLRLQI